METDIKCLECGKVTRNFELGRVFYNPGKAAESVIIQDAVVCPKCDKDVSNEKFLIKQNSFFMSLITANACLSEETPKNLRHTLPVFREKDYLIIKDRCKSKPKFAEKF